MKKWRIKNLNKRRESNRFYNDKWKGILESKFENKLLLEFPYAISLDRITPDFYDQKNNCFIEIKRALPFKKYLWMYKSAKFPGLFFYKAVKHTRIPTVDEQIAKYPKPLLVIIIHAITGDEIIRKIYYNKDDETYPYFPVKIIPEINLIKTCPVCQGKGCVERYPDILPGVVIPSTTAPIPLFITCNRCNGTGKIDANDTYYPDYYPLNPHCPMHPIHPYPQTTDPSPFVHT